MSENDSSNSNSQPFEIALVMSGAISAGAYTAGVIDFLLEALDEWQKAKDEGRPDCPQHEVKLKVMSGTSAGALTASILAAGLCGDISPATQLPECDPHGNPLYESWVNRIDIKELLGVRDLSDPEQQVVSLLDSTVIAEILSDAMTIKSEGKPRKYISDVLQLFVSVTNLRGVPYSLGFKEAQKSGLEMLMHSDYMYFRLSENPVPIAEGIAVDWAKREEANWNILKQTSIASGAFPIALAPILLQRPRRNYNERLWPIPQSGSQSEGQAFKCYDLKPIPPNWPDGIDETYSFLCVDGGVMNNDPLELARRALGGVAESNPRDARDTTSALLLIDPFPHNAPFTADYEAYQDLWSVFGQLFLGLIQQALFKPAELALALDPNVYSQFLIAPIRNEVDTLGREHDAKYPLASGSLSGFGGFLARDFRRHDFQLGRRNCQRFLERYFTLPAAGPQRNRIFKEQPPPAINRWLAKRQEKETRPARENHLPIIPLIGSATIPVQQLDWPGYTQRDVDALREELGTRSDKVVRRLIEDSIEGFFERLGLKTYWFFRRGNVVNTIIELILNDLTVYGLYQQSGQAAKRGGQ